MIVGLVLLKLDDSVTDRRTDDSVTDRRTDRQSRPITTLTRAVA